jgi:hypothetical protein
MPPGTGNIGWGYESNAVNSLKACWKAEKSTEKYVAGDALIYIIQWGLGVCKGVGGWESNILFATSFVALHFWNPMPPPSPPPQTWCSK